VAFLRAREDGRTVVRVQVPFVQTNVGGVGGYGLSDVSVKVIGDTLTTTCDVPNGTALQICKPPPRTRGLCTLML
jgi:hypothetical protein